MAKAKPVAIDSINFSKKGDALNYMKEMLNSYSLEEHVNKEHHQFLLAALKHHPEGEDKVGVGVAHFFVRRADYETRCFWIRRVDGTEVRFSYKSCV